MVGRGEVQKKEGAHDRGAAAVSVCKTYTFSYKISYNPAWQKEAVNRGQNWLFNRSNRHKDQIMAWTRAGSRPEEWWVYEKQMPQPHDLGEERITLFEMVALTETELAELIPEWREEYERANEPNFSYCTGHGWLRGEAAKRALYRWAGIPPALVNKWDAARRRRAKTIRKLAEPPADSGGAAGETDGADRID